MSLIKKVAAILLISNICHAADEIAVVLPMEHRAMNEIVRGLKDELARTGDDKNLVIHNAMGDTNNMHAIVSQLVMDPSLKSIMPVGSSATYLTMAATKEIPVISLASPIDNDELENFEKNGHTNLFVINEEVHKGKIIDFISKLGKKNILIVHSNEDRIYKHIKEAEEAAKQNGISINKFNVISPVDIYSINSMLGDIDCILIMKDHTIVSMIGVILESAHSKNIPVVTSDEGSLIEGADLAIGVTEYDIGVAGAKLYQKVKNQQKVNGVQNMNDFKVFYRDSQNNHIPFEKVKEIADSSGYPTELVK